MSNITLSAAFQFTSDDFDAGNFPFSPADYARLKYGDDEIAKQFGNHLANRYFNEHHGELLIQPVVVIPSPFNYVENAATIMTRHFVRRLNHLLVSESGIHVDFATIQRKVSYAGDFGTLDAATRRVLIGGDRFYLHEDFFADKTLVIVDDVRITGAHEERLMGLFEQSQKLKNSALHFVYYGRLCGDEGRSDIEHFLNNADMSLSTFVDMTKQPNHHFIVRPMKWLLRMAPSEFSCFLHSAEPETLRVFYDGCLGEGYYKVPDYQANFLALKDTIIKWPM